MAASQRLEVTNLPQRAAMSTDGGVLVYGLGEDDNERLTMLDPRADGRGRSRTTDVATPAASWDLGAGSWLR